MALGSLLIALAVHWSAASDSPLAFAYVSVGVYSAYFFGRRPLVGQLALAAASYGAALATTGAGEGGSSAG